MSELTEQDVLRSMLLAAVDAACAHDGEALAKVTGIADQAGAIAQMAAPWELTLGTGDHKFSSTQFNLADGGYSRSQGSPLPTLMEMALAIPDDDLAEDGRETEDQHVTVKYGLHTDDAEEVRRVVAGFGPMVIRLGKTSLFPAKGDHQFDVVKVDVESADLHRLNELIAESLEHTDTHPVYHPHITLAYVKAGLGEKYEGLDDVEGQEMNLVDLVFSARNGTRTTINLMRGVKAAKKTDKQSAWTSYEGPHGGKGWKRGDDIRYQEDRPGEDHSLASATDSPKKKTKGQWITIGGSKGEGGNRHGGSPVYIENGRITKGAPSLQGKKIDALKDDGEDSRSSRKQAVDAKSYGRAAHAKNARKEGLNPADLRQLAAEVIAHDKAFTDEHNRGLSEARRLSKHYGVNISNLSRAFKDGDADQLKHFDEVADVIAPEMFPGADPSEWSQMLFDALKAGNREPMSEEDAYEQAMDHLRQHKAATPDDNEDATGDTSFDPWNFGLTLATDDDKSSKWDRQPTPDDLPKIVLPNTADEAEIVLGKVLAAFKGLRIKLKKEILKAIKNGPPAGAVARVRKLLGKRLPELAQALTDANVAAGLAAMKIVADDLPPLGTMEQPTPLAPGGLPPEPPWATTEPGAPPPPFRLRIIEEAVKDLRGKRAVTRATFDTLTATARAQAFTVAGVQTEALVAKLRDVTAEAVDNGWTKNQFVAQAEAQVGQGTFISPAHAETVFRNGVMGAFSDGQQKILEQPIVNDLLPYRAYFVIDDDRTRPEHLYFKTGGIQGTNIYRGDDPVFQLFRPPWAHRCRCGWNAMSVRGAAAAGIQEAIDWLKNKTPPAKPAWVKMPDFRPDPSFRRQ